MMRMGEKCPLRIRILDPRLVPGRPEMVGGFGDFGARS